MMKWLRTHWKKLLLITAAVIAVAAVLVLEVFSRGAAAIFNQAMMDQDMLKGEIRADKIVAHINGHVEFSRLQWHDPEGRLILYVPEGSFEVRPWDVITGNIKSTTMQELTIRNAAVAVRLSDDMRVDFVRSSPDMQQVKEEDTDWRAKVSLAGKSEEERKQIGEYRRKKHAERMAKQWHNFEREGKKIRMKLKFEDCRLEVFHKRRHYLLSKVNMLADINTDDDMILELSTGHFGGTMIGNGVKLKGTVDFDGAELPLADFYISFMDVDPSSLGMGINIHDKMTLDSHLTGPLHEISGEGHVRMEHLHIPALDFENVRGRVDYDGEKLYFNDVEASVFGGKLVADGEYDLDTRYYSIHGIGTDLQAQKALPGSHLSCNVDLDMFLSSKGSGRETSSYGHFSSGEGRFKIIPFKSMSGKFRQGYRDLEFNDVAIEFAGLTMRTDYLQVKEGKLTFNPINITDKNGELLAVYEGRK